MKKILFIFLIALSSCEKEEEPKKEQRIYEVTYYAYSRIPNFYVMPRVPDQNGIDTVYVPGNTYTATYQVAHSGYQMSLIVWRETKQWEDDSIYARVSVLDRKDEIGDSFHGFSRITVKIDTPPF